VISALILLTCIELVLGAVTAKDAAPILYEKCYGDLNTYHIQLLGLHQHGGNMKPATSCGDPQGSYHYNLHIDLCLPGKSPACNNCAFPFTTWPQYNALRRQYIRPIFNWHAFQYTNAADVQCTCLYDSVTRATYDNCVETDVKDNLLLLVADVEGMAEAIWEELVDLPWTTRVVIISFVVAACALLLPALIEAAGLAITADVIAEMVALFVAWATTAFAPV
jgi:hypothetical protein